MHTSTDASSVKKEIEPLLSAWRSQGKSIDFVKEFFGTPRKSCRPNDKINVNHSPKTKNDSKSGVFVNVSAFNFLF